MNKKTKMVLGVAALGAVAYYLWKKSKTAAFANQSGPIGIYPTIYGSGAAAEKAISSCTWLRRCSNGRAYCFNTQDAYSNFKCPVGNEDVRYNVASVLAPKQNVQQGRISGM
jgi:hypothetical protein